MRGQTFGLGALLMIFIGSAMVTATFAADRQLTAEEYERRIDQLEKDVQDLKKERPKAESAAAPADAKPIAGYQDGFFIQTPDGNFRLNPSVWTHFDSRFFINEGDDGTTQFTFRRVRLDIRGTVYKYFEGRMMTDFSGGRVTLFDAYLNVKYFDFARLQLGKYKVPASLERLQSATNLLFIERAYPSGIMPNRDLGFMLHGDVLNAAFSYQLGIFDGGADGASNTNDLDINDDKMFAGRVFAHPFKNLGFAPVANLGLGIAGTFANERGSGTNTDLPSYRTFGQQTFFSYVSDNGATPDGTAFASGDQSRLSPQMYWYWGPLGSMFEYAWSQQEVTKGLVEDDVQTDAWHVRGSWVVTGEAATYKGVAPAHPFDPFNLSAGNWGALEVAVRGTQQHINASAFENGFATANRSARLATEWAVGANWYLNRNVLFALDFARTTFDGGRPNGRDRTPEEVFVARVQLVL